MFEDAFISVRPLKEPELDALRKWMRQNFFTLVRDMGGLTNETICGVARNAFVHISQEPVLDLEVEAIGDAFVRGIMDPQLANLVDEIVQELRVRRKLPASRWATFVHVGA